MDREELEQRVTDSLEDRDQEYKHARTVIQKMELDHLFEYFKKGGDRE